jgi:MinD superfamily P-loop ATPase
MRTIVIASGKGGTGKTTLTALLAHRAAQEGTVVVADADVDAANLPIALRAETVSCEDFAGGSTAVVNPALCIGCAMCARACRFDAILWSDVTSMIQSYSVDPLMCEGCGLCVHLCPSDAIELVPNIAGVSCVGQATTGSISYGELKPAQDLSGKLVTKVRELADGLAKENEADWILVDGPPGIGCPVIASVTGADVLIAVTLSVR